MDELLAPFAWIGAVLLLFFVPGFAVARAVFPERRFRGPTGLRGAFELVVLSFVLSVVLTLLAGYLLLSLGPGGFSATWSSPTLEVALAAVALVAFAVGLVEGAYSRTPPRSAPAPDPGEEGAWEVTEQLDRIAAERRRAAAGALAGEPREAALARARAAESEIARRREAEYER